MDQEKSNSYQEQQEAKNRKKQPLPNLVAIRRGPTHSTTRSSKHYRPYVMKANMSQAAM